jgi:methylated-DNA-protein-cysteine methyltransferase-like protein
VSHPPPPGADHAHADRGLTDFQRAVVTVIAALEPGEVVTYGDVAVEVGRPGGAQAVANVLRRVPGLPWWRVVPTSGRLYRTHAPTQAPLLLAEGVEVDADRRVGVRIQIQILEAAS